MSFMGAAVYYVRVVRQLTIRGSLRLFDDSYARSHDDFDHYE